MGNTAKKPTNLSIDSNLLSEAKELKVNLSRAAEEGVRAAVTNAKAAKWKAENAAAIDSSNLHVEKFGLPLGRFRPF